MIMKTIIFYSLLLLFSGLTVKLLIDLLTVNDRIKKYGKCYYEIPNKLIKREKYLVLETICIIIVSLSIVFIFYLTKEPVIISILIFYLPIPLRSFLIRKYSLHNGIYEEGIIIGIIIKWKKIQTYTFENNRLVLTIKTGKKIDIIVEENQDAIKELLGNVISKC